MRCGSRQAEWSSRSEGLSVRRQFSRHLVCGIFLQTMTVCPVLESIRVVTGSQRHDTVFAFSCLVTTQCSITSAVGGGIWLRTGAGAAAGGGEGGGAAATGFFLAEQPTRHKSNMSHRFLIRRIATQLVHYNLRKLPNL